MDMQKDTFLTTQFEAYFRGAERPALDLSAAKAAVKETKTRRDKTRSALISSLSAAAGAAAVFALLFGVYVPALKDHIDSIENARPKHYTVAEAQIRASSYEEFQSEEWKDVLGKILPRLLPFTVADNASCAYSVYTYGGVDVLAVADLSVIVGASRVSAKVYTDLTNGKYIAEDFGDTQDYANMGGYHMNTKYVNGEFESCAYWGVGAVHHAEISSPKERGAKQFMEFLLK